MKKIILSSFVLLFFSASIFVFQLSCQKEVTAQTSSYTLPPATTTTLGGIIVGSGLAVTSNGILSVTCCGSGSTQIGKILFIKGYNVGGNEYGELWTANYDGTNQTKINVAIPTGFVIDYAQGEARLSPDGGKVFFELFELATTQYYIYTCNIDGTNLLRIVNGSGTNVESVRIQGVY